MPHDDDRRDPTTMTGHVAETAPANDNADLEAFYADRKLMWRNVFWITFGHFGMALSMTIVEPLMTLRLRPIGVPDSGIGLITSANLWVVSFLVMYFSWKSDHCTSKLGRRTPFVLISLPVITLALILFPLFSTKWLLIGLMIIYFYFNDMKASTYPLLSIDCVSKEILARVSGIVAIVISLAGFFSSRIGAKMADTSQTRVFVLGDCHGPHDSHSAVANQRASVLSPHVREIQSARSHQSCLSG